MYACVHTHICIPFPSVSSARARTHTRTHTEEFGFCLRAVGWLPGRQGLFLTMLLDVVPNAVSHLRCQALLSHHLTLYFLPGHLSRQIPVREPWAASPVQSKCEPFSGCGLKQKLPVNLYPGANLPLWA